MTFQHYFFNTPHQKAFARKKWAKHGEGFVVLRYFLFRFLLCAALFAAIGLSQLQAQPASRIKIVRVATVDLTTLLNVVRNDRAIERKLMVRKSADLLKIEELQNAIVELNQYLKSNEEILSKDKYAEIQDEIALKQKELQALSPSPRGGTGFRFGRISNDAIRGLYQLIKKEAQVQGFSMVIEKSNAVIYVDEDLDLTALIKTKLQQMSDSNND